MTTAELTLDPAVIYKHYVGTYPAATADKALANMLPGDAEHPEVNNIYCAPSGETNAPRWIVDQLESYKQNRAFQIVEGTENAQWNDYEDCPQFTVTPGWKFKLGDTDLKYHQSATEAWPAFERARQRIGKTALKFQVGIPSPLDMTLFTLGEPGLTNEEVIEAFTADTLQQIEKIHNEPFGKDVVYQIETPASLSVALRVEDSEFRRGLMKRITDFVARAPEGTRFGVHLCVGDLNNEARQQPRDRKASVELANMLAEMWPEGRHFDYVHEPIAAGSKPPFYDVSTVASLKKTLGMYSDLKDLRLDSSTRYIAGIVHEKLDLKTQRKILEIVKAFLPKNQALGVSAACGLGRRSLADAKRIDRRMQVLTN